MLCNLQALRNERLGQIKNEHKFNVALKNAKTFRCEKILNSNKLKRNNSNQHKKRKEYNSNA